MAGVTHDANITINITLDAAPAQEAGFGTVLYVGPKATNALNGQSIVAYTNVADAVIDEGLGYIDQTTLDAVTAMFSQSPKPATVKVGWVDIVGTETIAAALARISLIDDAWYGVCIHLRTDAAVLALSAAVEATRKICAVQSADAGFLTGTYPAALTALQTRERTLIVWHDSATEHMDAALLANRLVYDPDVLSASWDAPISGVAIYTAAITAAQRAFALANFVNIGRPYGGSAFFVDAGVNATGRPMYEIETADWFYARILEDVAAEKVAHSARGAKLTVDPIGQTKILSILNARGAQGMAGQSPHFLAFEAQAVEITDADRTANRMRFTAQAQDAVSGRIFTFDLNFSRDALS